MFVQRTHPRTVFGALLILPLLLVAGLATGVAFDGRGAPPSMAPDGAVGAHLSEATGSHPAVGNPIGPIGGRLYDVRSELPSGATNSVTGLAVDPSTGLVYASNEFAATITVFNESTGVVVQVQPVGSFAAGDYPAGVLLDPVGHRLFVSISTRFSTPGAGGWLLVLNESTLATEANISFVVSPKPPFEPTFVAYDAPTDQLFAENATGGLVATIDLADGAVTGYLACPLATCAQHPYGLVDVPQFHTLVVPTCAKALWLVNTSNDSTRALISGPSNGALMAWTAFDSADRIMWVENYSYYGSVGSFLGYNLTTLALVASAPGAPARESGMSYDPIHNVLVTTNIDASESIATFNGTTGVRVASSQSSNTTGHPFLAVTVDPRTGIAIAGGPGNGTTLAYTLPSLGIERVYSSFPLTQTAATTDPVDGNLLITTTDPNTLEAQNESSGAVVWTDALSASADPVAVAYDNATASVYVADSASASVLAFAASNGAYQATDPVGTTPSGLCALAVDPAKSLLYVGSTAPAEIVAFNLSFGTVVGSFPLAPYSPCRLAVDQVNHELFVLATPGASDLFVLAPDPGGLMTERAVWGVPSSALDLAVSPTGDAYVLANSGAQLVTLTPPAGAISTSLNLTTSPASALALDPVDGLLFLAASFEPSVEVVGTAGLTLDGALSAPNTVGPVAFDPSSGTLVAGTQDTGQVMIAGLVPVPSSPTLLSVVSGNDSFAASWGLPVSSGADPVTGYAVSAQPEAPNLTAVSRNVTGLAASIGNLTDGVPYTVTVAAVSLAGAGTSVANATATPAGIPYPPTYVGINGTGSSSLTINWSAPASDDGAVVFDYVVHYAPTGGGSALAVDARDATSVVLGGLSAQTEYSVYVTAQNSVGFGHPSTTVTATTAPPASSALLYLSLGLGGAVVLVAVVVVLAGRRSRRRPGAPSATSTMDGAPEAADAEGGAAPPA